VKVVLTQDVPSLGRAGDVKEVSPGYARNYLLPRKLAVVATDAALKQVEQKRAAAARQAERRAEEVRALGQRIEGTELRFRARAAEKRLYGSIHAHEIAEELSKVVGHEIDKREVDLPEPIKTTGTHTVTIRLARTVTPRVRVIVEAE
jgi:large subunit ribosomal protein L9